MKLLKIDGYWIVVSNEPIEPCSPPNICNAHITKPCDKCGRFQGRKLLFSQNPEHNLPTITFSDEVAKELGVVDIRSNILKALTIAERKFLGESTINDLVRCFNQSLQDNTDKLFTLEQLEEAYIFGVNAAQETHLPFEDYIQSLSKQEYDCELEMEEKCWCLKPVRNGCNECIGKPKISNNSVKVVKILK